MQKTKTFFDVPNRTWALRTPEAEYLRSVLPPHIWENLESAFLRTGLDSPEAKVLFEYLHERSSMTKAVKIRPSDAIPFECIYRKRPTSAEVDKFFIRSKAAIGIYLRLLALEDNLPQVLRQCIGSADLKRDERVNVLNAGSGPSHEMIEVLSANRDLAKLVKVLAVDTDDTSLEIGRQRVAELQLEDSFEFRAASFEEMQPTGAHLILLIGILCPLPSTIGVRVLRSMMTHSTKGGRIIYSTVQEEMINGDPLLDLFMRGLQWKMDYKTETESERMGKASGWTTEGAFHDALRYNRMTIAKRA